MKKIAKVMGGGGGTNVLKPPRSWTDPENPALRIIDVVGKERDQVEAFFMTTLKTHHRYSSIKVKKVERVQNLQMWQSYAVKRNIIKNVKSMTNNQGDKVKTWLFHGTSIDTVPKIQTQGFNRAFAGKNAVACTYCPCSSASCFTCRT